MTIERDEPVEGLVAIRGECTCGGGFMLLVRPSGATEYTPTGDVAQVGTALVPVFSQKRVVVPVMCGASYDFRGVTKETACPAVAACRRFEEECVR